MSERRRAFFLWLLPIEEADPDEKLWAGSLDGKAVAAATIEDSSASLPTCAQRARITERNTTRSTSGEAIGLSSRLGWVQLPHGSSRKQNVAKLGIAVAGATDRRFDSDRSD